ncbi:MAG: hypothetical protein ABS69_16230 [Nitrosomonadales bacterium SCN 54-20]|nr:MAG: hypothetical protein ABS69_16230 [Nitrosomonadales bacterium SCN 54-20]
MKVARTTLIKRSIASITAGVATLAPVSGSEAALFSVSAVIQEQIGLDAGCASHMGGSISGSGISSFGAVSLAAKDCITPAADFSYFSFQGKMTFAFFGGDQIFADYWGQFVPSSPSIFTLKTSFFDITGGTGRFQNADGGENLGRLYGTEVISSDFSSGWGLIQVTGDITGLKKSKKGTESSLELLDLTDPADGNVIVAINELPESDSLALLGIGLASLAFVRRKVSR